MLLTALGAGVGSTASDALLFARFGVAALPQLYLALGIVSLVVALGVSALFGAVRRERVYPIALIGLALLLVALRILLASGEGAYPVMWLGANVVGMLQGIVAWGVASWLCDARQAKRIFPLANAAKILGTIIGTAAVGLLVRVVALEDLLVVWALALAATLAVVLWIRGSAPAAAPAPQGASLRDELLVGFRIVRRSRLLRWLAISLVLFSVLFFALALPFTRSVRAAMPDEADLASFLGLFNATTTAAAFLASLFVANRFYARFGVVNAILGFTLIYLAAFVVLVATDSFIAIVAVRWIQLAWLAGIADAAYQALFNPVPAERRDQMRAFMEGVPGQAGIALAGLLLVVGDRALEPRAVAVGGVVVAAAAAAVIWRARAAYRDALVDALRSGRPEPFLGAEDAYARLLEDRAALDAALAGLQASEPATRRASAQILADLAPASAAGALLAAAVDPDGGVRAQALRGGARVAPAAFADLAARSLGDPDAGVRAASALVLLRVAPDDARVVSALAGDAAPRAALAQMLGDSDWDGAATILERLARDEDQGTRSAALTALARCARSRALAVADAELQSATGRERALEIYERIGGAHDTPALRALSERWRDEALGDAVLAERVAPDRDVAALLRLSLERRSARLARDAVRAAAIRSGRQAPIALLDGLVSADARVRADALETLETYVARDLVRPLLAIWEPDARPPLDLAPLADHDDPWIRTLAHQLATGGGPMTTLTTIPLVERVLFLHRIPLFAALDPADLQQVARIATERSFADGETIARQGDAGDALFVITSGTVKVLQDGRVVAERAAGDAIGEMAIVSDAARIASLAAAGDVRTLRIARAEFQAMLRDRPETAMGVIRVLATRLAEATATR